LAPGCAGFSPRISHKDLPPYDVILIIALDESFAGN